MHCHARGLSQPASGAGKPYVSTVRTLIVSNRLPFSLEVREKSLKFHQSAGGLVSGLSSYLDSMRATAAAGGASPEYLWIGWPGASVPEQWRTNLIERSLAEQHAYPVFVTEAAMEKFYQGFCNRTIWPLFHYFPAYANYDEDAWRGYHAVNRTFCDAVMEVARQNDIIWVHDYHLMLLPQMLRERMPEATIGFFLHIPFPSFEIFRMLPAAWRTDILHGLLGADLVGLHTHHYSQYILRSVLRVLGLENNMGQILLDHRIVAVDTFPMGIDFDKYDRAAGSHEVQSYAQTLREGLGEKKVVLSVDRLDYSKGIVQRLKAYERFLEENRPHWNRVVLILIVVPSRVAVDHYQEMKKQIDEVVGRINGRFGNVGWTPILYQYRFLSLEHLSALYVLSDVALVTPLRDGMNLVAKEYLASRTDQTGVLILSEMAGASSELGEALVLNPNNIAKIAEYLRLALCMPRDEQIRRNRTMRKRLQRYSVQRWASDFINRLLAVKEQQHRLDSSMLGEAGASDLARRYALASSRLLLLECEAAVAAQASDSRQSPPEERLLKLLSDLCRDPRNDVVLVSGWDRPTMDRWFGGLRLSMVAEHGTFLKEAGRAWKPTIPLSAHWKQPLLPILEVFVDRLPGAFIEETEYSLVWNYRKADPEQSSIRAKELLDHLVTVTANLNVQVVSGRKVLQLRNTGASKGKAVLLHLEKRAFDFALAIGVDATDEEMFSVLPADAFRVKVGPGQSNARYRLGATEDVLRLLERMNAGSAGLAAAPPPGDDEVGYGEEKFEAGEGQDQVH